MISAATRQRLVGDSRPPAQTTGSSTTVDDFGNDLGLRRRAAARRLFDFVDFVDHFGDLVDDRAVRASSRLRGGLRHPPAHRHPLRGRRDLGDIGDLGDLGDDLVRARSPSAVVGSRLRIVTARRRNSRWILAALVRRAAGRPSSPARAASTTTASLPATSRALRAAPPSPARARVGEPRPVRPRRRRLDWRAPRPNRQEGRCRPPPPHSTGRGGCARRPLHRIGTTRGLVRLNARRQNGRTRNAGDSAAPEASGALGRVERLGHLEP